MQLLLIYFPKSGTLLNQNLVTGKKQTSAIVHKGARNFVKIHEH